MKSTGSIYTAINADSAHETWMGKLHCFKPIHHNILVIGHRGASGLYPENTMISFEAACRMGSDMIELDVQLSRDGIPVVSHDATVNRCTDGKGPIRSYTGSELKTLDAGSWFSRRFSGERIPFLEEVLNYANGKTGVNIEIKAGRPGNTDELVRNTLDAVSGTKMENHVLFSSFNRNVLKKIRKLSPGAMIGLLYEKNRRNKTEPVDLMKRLSADSFHTSKRILGKKILKKMAENHYPVLVFTVNRSPEMRKWIGLGAKGLFTNRPDICRRVVDSLDSEQYG